MTRIRSDVPMSSSFGGAGIESASYALSASYAANGGGAGSSDWDDLTNVPIGLVSSSVQVNSGSFTGSFTGSATVAVSSSFATNALTANSATTATSADAVAFANITGKPTLVSASSQINTGSFTGSFTGSILGSASYALSASYAANGGGVADWNTLTGKPAGLVSSSIQINTGSFTGSFTGALAGAISTALTASYISGNVSFPNGLGITGSLNVLGSVTASSGITGSVTGSLLGSSSYSVTSSYALTSPPAAADWSTITNKPVGLVSSSVQINSGSFTGSFTGSVTNAVSSSFATNALTANSATSADAVAFANITGKPTLVSSSIQIDHDATTNFDAAEHFTQANITTVGTVTAGNINAILPTGTVSSSLQLPAGIQSSSYGIAIESPTAAEDISWIFTDKAITIRKMVAVCVGTTPSVTWTVRHGTDRSAAGAEVVTGGTTTTSTTSGDTIITFNDATIVANAFIWLETTAQSGTVTSLQVTLFYTVD